MGEAKRRREAAGPGGPDPGIAALSAALAADAKADFDRFRRSRVPGRTLFTAEIMSIERAEVHPLVGPTVVKAAVASYTESG